LNVEPASITRYTWGEVLLYNVATEHYGPWRADLQALCNPRRR